MILLDNLVLSIARKDQTKKKFAFSVSSGNGNKQWLFYPEHETELEFKHWLTKIEEQSFEKVSEDIVINYPILLML